MRPTLMCLCGLLILVTATISGCGEEDQGPEPTQVGAISIDPEPNSVDASWQLMGPGDFSQSGTGDLLLADLTVGDYTLAWGAVVGWTTPSPEVVTQTLVVDGTLTFTGTYVTQAQAGTITINPEPNSISASWKIAGPAGFSQEGTGDLSLADMTAGDYTLTWEAEAGWTTPSPAAVTQSLAADGTLTFTGTYIENGGIPVGFVSIAAGNFTMGSPTDERGRHGDETRHQVTLTHGLYVQTTEVTNQQYMELAQWAYEQGHVTVSSNSLWLNDNLDGSTEHLKSLGSGSHEISFSNGVFSCVNPNHPVKNVTWYGSAAYCDWLSLQQGLQRAYNHATWQCNESNPYTAAGYRLPTEAEWEYACRAGSTTAFANGQITRLYCDDPNLDQVGWYCGNAGDSTLPVAQKLPNAWGLYDMHGNLFEWCNDWYAPYGGMVTDPVGPGAGNYKPARGGNWSDSAKDCRSAYRQHDNPSLSDPDVGFRPVRSSD